MCVDSLTSDKASVPIVLEKLLEHVEMHGLYTEGLYRKSGAANRTRELRQALQTGGCQGVSFAGVLRHHPPAHTHQPPAGLLADPAAVKLENFPIHAITGVLKQWLRELPEPLMTFAQYGDFLRAVGEAHSSLGEGGRTGGRGRAWNHERSPGPTGEAPLRNPGSEQLVWHRCLAKGRAGTPPWPHTLPHARPSPYTAGGSPAPRERVGAGPTGC